MKKISIICILFIIVSACSSDKKNVKNDDSTLIQKNDMAVEEGWLDNDTYTVHVTGADQGDAMDKAKYQILKDIINVRMLNKSRYTDITKIQTEFEGPLKKGKIIKKNEINNGIEIWFQITDKGLKEKFQRQ